LDNPEDFVRLEIGTALRREICVIPVLVDGVKMPRSTDLPEDLKSIAWLQALKITGESFEGDCIRLAAAIKQELEEAAAQERERLATEARQREEKERLEAELREKERGEAGQGEKERLEAEEREKEPLGGQRVASEIPDRQKNERLDGTTPRTEGTVG
jgi:hypothetical protein